MRSQLEKLPINVFFNIVPFLEWEDVQNLYTAAEQQQDEEAAEETSSSSSSSGSTFSTLNNEASTVRAQEEKAFIQEEQEAKRREEQAQEQAELPIKKRKTMSMGGTTSVIKTCRIKKKSTAVKTYPCPICDHVSSRSYNLTTHIKTHDKERMKEFGCELCKKRFDRRHDRERHLASVHRNERSYTCERCAVSFSRRDALDRHFYQKHQN